MSRSLFLSFSFLVSNLIDRAGSEGTQKPRNSKKNLATGSFLPDPASILANHGLPGFASPSLLKFGHVLQNTIDAIATGRVRVGVHEHARIFGPAFFAPDPPEPEEEPLLGCVPVNLLAGLASFVGGDHLVQRHQRDSCATIVRSVFAQR